MGVQITASLLMVRPVQFRLNEETAINNYYQKNQVEWNEEEAQRRALNEFDNLVDAIKSNGIKVIVIDDTLLPETPDSIFPNNWVSFHKTGTVVLYPMFAKNRRAERRDDIIKMLQHKYNLNVKDVIDLTVYEKDEKFLEGTGSMVLDRENKIAYASISERTNLEVIKIFCNRLDYKHITFHATQVVSGNRLPIYHTNVMMCVADEYVIICLDAIKNNIERNKVIESINNTGKEIIEITQVQKEHFVGNMLQVQNSNMEKFVIMSSTAFSSLTTIQLNILRKHNKIIHSDIPTIETLGGGSVRCMISEIYLPTKNHFA